jgi:threonylcarbamoyladenosine tRNA methylthiotransferase MtaB
MDADVLVVNSCTVTEEADRDVRRLIRRVSRRNPSTRIIVTGCYAQRRPEELASMRGVGRVVGNSHKSLVGSLALQSLRDSGEVEPRETGRAEIFCSDIFEERVLPGQPFQGSAGRTRATVKVQDGCNANCSFCIIPTVRGRSRSLAPESVLEHVRDLATRGFPEVVFSGIHLGSYGRDLPQSTSLAALVRETIEGVPELARLRLSSIEPLEVTDVIVDLVESEARIAKHLHIPMQSGSTRVLRAMRRPYSREVYANLVSRVRERIPVAAIGADVMVGFPGETDHEFLETYRLIEASPLTYLHVFPYSPRPGTPAAELEPVPVHVARFRGDQLRRLIARKNLDFRRSLVGRDLEVLVLDGTPISGSRPGLSDNFVRVSVPDHLEPGQWRRVWVTRIEGDGLRAVC